MGYDNPELGMNGMLRLSSAQVCEKQGLLSSHSVSCSHPHGMLEKPCPPVAGVSLCHMYPNPRHWFPSWCAIGKLFRKCLDRQVAIGGTAALS